MFAVDEGIFGALGVKVNSVSGTILTDDVLLTKWSMRCSLLGLDGRLR